MNASLEQRLRSIRQRIDAAQASSDAEVERSAPVQLIAVSKRHPLAAIEAAAQCGQLDFGENYAQEFVEKFEALNSSPDMLLRWHFIGQVQRNKVKALVGRALIHTVDRLQLVDALEHRSKLADLRARGCEVLVEVNSGEAQKGGVRPKDLPALLDRISETSHVSCRGLMTMAPAGDAESARPHFRALRVLRQKEQARPRPGVDLRELSMGMSGDFEVAIQEGATMVRVGTAIFGDRPVQRS